MIDYPDSHDYFRYTHEALLRLLADAGFTKSTVIRIGDGPLLSNFNTIVLSLPHPLRPLLYLPYAFLDALFVALRPESRNRNPLGYVFISHV